MPLGTLSGIRAGATVRATGAPLQVPVGEALLGRVLDGLGRPLDGGPPLSHLARVAVEGNAPNPLLRGRVDLPLSLGVRALDTLVPSAAASASASSPAPASASRACCR